mmetsp:Transcript_2217/g.8822  ORF Transcript_2217/g.8822 Transcript_2217/m.8822 type:complete len:173 (-) Transcript_2217:906-1424(-)
MPGMRVRPGDVCDAVRGGDARKLGWLLQAGADKEEAAAGPDGSKFTALFGAASMGNVDCVHVLLEAGADLLRAAADERRTVAELEALRVGDSGPQRSGRSRSSRRRCAHCGKTSAQVKAEGGKMQKCAACTNAADTDIVPPRYCSRACQVAAWPEHKRVCAGRAGSARARDD